VAGPIEILGRDGTRWRQGPCGAGLASIEPCYQGAGLRAALLHPEARHSARVANGPGSGLHPVHHHVSDSHRLPEDGVCHGLPPPALPERGVYCEAQSVLAGARLHTGSTQGEPPIRFFSSGWFVIFGHLRINVLFFSGICKAALSALSTSLRWHATRHEEWRDGVQRDPARENFVSVPTLLNTKGGIHGHVIAVQHLLFHNLTGTCCHFVKCVWKSSFTAFLNNAKFGCKGPLPWLKLFFSPTRLGNIMCLDLIINHL